MYTFSGIYIYMSIHIMEKEMATHSSNLAWRISWTEEPAELQSMETQRVRHNVAINTFLFRKKTLDRQKTERSVKKKPAKHLSKQLQPETSDREHYSQEAPSEPPLLELGWAGEPSLCQSSWGDKTILAEFSEICALDSVQEKKT